jgi:hypothetical protein
MRPNCAGDEGSPKLHLEVSKKRERLPSEITGPVTNSRSAEGIVTSRCSRPLPGWGGHWTGAQEGEEDPRANKTRFLSGHHKVRGVFQG